MKTISCMKYLLVLFLFAAMSCEKYTMDQVFTIGKESTFRLNQIDYSADGQYTLLINEITDSRCPEGVQCVWAGEVSLKGEWTYNGRKYPIELHTVLKDRQIEPEGFSIQIVDAKPSPKYGVESKPEDLVITLLVQKK